MAQLRPPFQKDIYKDFKRIEVGALRTIVYYYEQYEQAIRDLDEEQYVEMTIDYAQALYQLQWHNRFVVIVDNVLELIIIHNVYTYQGENVFEKMLFQKAVSSIETKNYASGILVLQELLKINPNYPLAYKNVQKAFLFQYPVFFKTIRASIIVLSLFTALLIAVELLVVHNFYPTYQPIVEHLRIGLFLVVLFLFFGSIAWHFVSVYTRAKTVLAVAKAHFIRKKN
jgi:tetratricopeptide (TPR) repeat protein